MENEPRTVILDDFNINFNKASILKDFFHSKDFAQLIKFPTHYSGSLIDQIYISQELQQEQVVTKQFATYYTDHDILSVWIKKQGVIILDHVIHTKILNIQLTK